MLTEGLECKEQAGIVQEHGLPRPRVAKRGAVKCPMKGEGASAVNAPETRQCGFPKQVDVLVFAQVEVLHHILLKEERVVGAHCAGAVEELLVVVAHVSLALGWEELINIHLVTQRHHEDDTWGGEQR